MCYICEARGTVGVGYRAAQELLHRPWRPRVGWPSWGDDKDWTASPVDRLWCVPELWAHGLEWRREHFLP